MKTNKPITVLVLLMAVLTIMTGCQLDSKVGEVNTSSSGAQAPGIIPADGANAAALTGTTRLVTPPMIQPPPANAYSHLYGTNIPTWETIDSSDPYKLGSHFYRSGSTVSEVYDWKVIRNYKVWNEDAAYVYINLSSPLTYIALRKGDPGNVVMEYAWMYNSTLGQWVEWQKFNYLLSGGQNLKRPITTPPPIVTPTPSPTPTPTPTPTPSPTPVTYHKLTVVKNGVSDTYNVTPNSVISLRAPQYNNQPGWSFYYWSASNSSVKIANPYSNNTTVTNITKDTTIYAQYRT
jgi:hypothetical protein